MGTTTSSCSQGRKGEKPEIEVARGTGRKSMSPPLDKVTRNEPRTKREFRNIANF